MTVRRPAIRLAVALAAGAAVVVCGMSDGEPPEARCSEACS